MTETSQFIERDVMPVVTAHGDAVDRPDEAESLTDIVESTLAAGALLLLGAVVLASTWRRPRLSSAGGSRPSGPIVPVIAPVPVLTVPPAVPPAVDHAASAR